MFTCPKLPSADGNGEEPLSADRQSPSPGVTEICIISLPLPYIKHWTLQLLIPKSALRREYRREKAAWEFSDSPGASFPTHQKKEMEEKGEKPPKGLSYLHTDLSQWGKNKLKIQANGRAEKWRHNVDKWWYWKGQQIAKTRKGGGIGRDREMLDQTKKIARSSHKVRVWTRQLRRKDLKSWSKDGQTTPYLMVF